ncbi:MAG: ABC transporter substrate-binding protein [Nodosilinea sp. LVE1205-7]|jgi:NitT/TauT family transport system substrate-binding protein
MFRSTTSRRRFLGLTMGTALAPAMLSLLNSCTGGTSTGSKGGNRAIKFAHGAGLCNMPLFYAAEKQLFSKYGFSGAAALTPMPADVAVQLATGQVEMAVIPFTNAIAAYTQGASFQVVAGSGVEGLILVAKPEIKSFPDLKGKKIATFQADTLDVVVYDYLKKYGMTYKDVEMVYLGDSTELLNAYISGQVDAVSHIEPYATKAKTSTKGNILGNGTDIYGKYYPDCVLAVRNEVIQKEPDMVKDVIRVFSKPSTKSRTTLRRRPKPPLASTTKPTWPACWPPPRPSPPASISAISETSCIVGPKACWS